MSVRKVVPIEKAEWHLSPTPAWVIAREPDWEFTPPEEHAVDFPLIDEQHHTASQACYRRTVRRVASLAALQALGQVEVEFDPAASRVFIHELAIWRKDGAGAWVPRSVATREGFLLRQREQQLEQQMLNGRVSLVALLEDLRVGDAIDLRWTLEPVDGLPGWRFAAYYAFAWSVPVARVFFTLHRDPAVPLTWRLHLPPETVAPREESAERTVTWSQERPPILRAEPNVPGSHWGFPLLDVTGWTSWGEVAEFTAELWAEALAQEEAALAAEAARLRAAAGGDPVAAARAAIRFVQEEVRYLAVDFGHGGGMLPNGAGTVLRRRFGDCKDKAVVLVALLRALGLEAWPLLVGAGWREAVARVQPSPLAFSHAIVTFVTGGQRVFIDPTFLGQGGDLARLIAPPYGCGLEVRAGAEGLLTLPPQPEATITLTETFTLEKKGGTGRVEQRLHATAWLADDLRAVLIRDGSAAFAKTRCEVLQRHFPALEAAEEAAVVSDSASENAVEWQTEYFLGTWGARGEKQPPFFRYGAHGLSLAIESLDGPEQRGQPWALRHPLRAHHRVIVRGDAVQRVKPETHRAEGPGFRYSCEVRPGSREVTFDYRWETTQREIAPAQWREYCQQRAKAFEHSGANVPTRRLSGATEAKLWLLGIIVVCGVVGVVRGKMDTARFGPRLPAAERRDLENEVSRAFGAMQKGDFAAAEPVLRRAAPHYRGNADFQNTYAEALLQTGHLAEVPPLLAEARRLNPGSLVADSLEGVLLEKRGELPQARAQFEKVLARDPKNLAVLHGVGRVAELLGDRAAAAQAWERFLAIQPGNPDVLLRYSLLLWAGGARQRADEVIIGAVRAQPVPGPVLEAQLASYYAQTGRPAEAVAPAKRAAELAPAEPQYLLGYTLALIAAGQARAALDFARGEAPKIAHPLGWRALAIAAATAGAPAEAEAAFQKWRQAAPRDPEMPASYGYFLHQIGRNTEARTILEQGVRDFPGHGLLWMNYSVVLGALGDPGAAEARRRAESLLSAGQRQALVR